MSRKYCRRSRSDENIDLLRTSVDEEPKTSISLCLQDEVTETTT